MHKITQHPQTHRHTDKTKRGFCKTNYSDAIIKQTKV